MEEHGHADGSVWRKEDAGEPLEGGSGAPRWAQVTRGVSRGVCGMRPDSAEGGPGLSSQLSVLSPQPWDSRPGVSTGGAAASPQDQTGRSHSSEGRAKGFPPQAWLSATMLACDNSQRGCACPGHL